jgi:hypothetical protein
LYYNAPRDEGASEETHPHPSHRPGVRCVPFYLCFVALTTAVLFISDPGSGSGPAMSGLGFGCPLPLPHHGVKWLGRCMMHLSFICDGVCPISFSQNDRCESESPGPKTKKGNSARMRKPILLIQVRLLGYFVPISYFYTAGSIFTPNWALRGIMRLKILKSLPLWV